MSASPRTNPRQSGKFDSNPGFEKSALTVPGAAAIDELGEGRTAGRCISLAAAVAAVAAAVPIVLMAQSPTAAQKNVSQKWMIGDFHNHTTYTDGSWPMNDLISPLIVAPAAVSDPSILYKQGTAPTAFRNGLDFFTNSEHGGIRERDGFGRLWNNTSAYPLSPAIGDSTSGRMWRWQSLIRTSDIPGYSGPEYMGAYDWILGIRAAYPGKLTMTGMEWNAPGHEHSSTGIVSRNALPVAEFEYRFDNSDTDGTSTTTTASTMGWPGKNQNSYYTANSPDYSAVLGLSKMHNRTIDGVKWMQANYPRTGYIIPAHVERAGCGVGGWSIAAFRDMNDNGPTVAFGFEGIPGHDKGPNRGEFSTSACGGGTYGGAGKYVTEVGGLWDNLLADGRKFFNFDNSDFHDDGAPSGVDFWPGQYEKTYIMVKDANGDGISTQEDVIDGMRSGNSFSTHGDLINELDFRAFHGNSVKNQSVSDSATMGETLSVQQGDKITVQIRFKSPAKNNCATCPVPVVNHVQLIQGRINDTKSAKFLADGVTPNPAYNAIDGTVASVVQTFDTRSWIKDSDGYTTMTFTVPQVYRGMFFRIRGTNLGYGVNVTASDGSTIYGTDAAGNPLRNTPNKNTEAAAWADLWFYSNPIFVSVN